MKEITTVGVHLAKSGVHRARHGREGAHGGAQDGAPTIPATTRGIPARSRTATISLNPAPSNSARTASVWSYPCSTTSALFGARNSRAPATIITIAPRPLPPGRERAFRLEANVAFGEVRIGRGDVGRVAHDEVERAAAPRLRNGVVPVRAHELDVGEAKMGERCHVPHPSAVAGNIGGKNAGAGGAPCAIASAMAPDPVPEVEHPRTSSFFGRRASASSTSVSVSGRGISTAGVTRISSPQNSR